MKNDEDQVVEKNDVIETLTQKRMQETSALTGRPNIDVITARNEEEVKNDAAKLYIGIKG